MDLEAGETIIRDRIKLPRSGAFSEFTLNPRYRIVSLSVRDRNGTHRIEPVNSGAGNYQLGSAFRGAHAVDIVYRGPIPRQPAENPADKTDFLLLGLSGGWYPEGASNDLLTFSLTARLPTGWRAVVNGKKDIDDGAGGTLRWTQTEPQQSIFFVASPFHRYQRMVGEILTEVNLLSQDPDLADRYLSAARRYLDLYNRMLGPYPYSRFSLVENKAQTGFGMPTFTLLGSRVIRLPFIPDTSFPHEIAHSWWGNSVYVDRRSGNWSEGLTTYLSDYLLSEIRGEGVRYRRDALMRYSDFVNQGNDIALSDFLGRRGEVTQAVGYQKGLFLFHMLRRQIGDDAFLNALREIYQRFRFARIGYTELALVVEAVSGSSVKPFFEQWTKRLGAPEIALGPITVSRSEQHYRIEGELTQIQSEPPFRVDVPVIVSDQHGNGAVFESIPMHKRKAAFSLVTAQVPAALYVDPHFDLFRRLHPTERPVTIGKVRGAESGVVLLPSNAVTRERQAMYRALADDIVAQRSGWRVVNDDDMGLESLELPTVVIGSETRVTDEILRRAKRHATRQGVPDAAPDTAPGGASGRAFAFAFRSQPNDPPILWIAADDAPAFESIARRLRHYNNYSFLTFRPGEAPLRGQWRVARSALIRPLGDRAIPDLPPAPYATGVLFQ